MIRGLRIVVVVLLCAAAAAEGPVPFSYWAVHASDEGREEKSYGPGLEGVRKTLDDLPYDTFRKISNGREAIVPGKRERVRLNANYTLCIQPVSREADGRYRVEIQVEMDPDDPDKPPVKALDTRMLMRPGEQVRMGGMRLEGEGDLVIILAAG
jgi:hypothetical protein